MRLAFISDIHANIQALTATAQFLETQVVDQVVVVGDLVGYGANPGPVIDFVQQRGYLVCLGSSDLRVALPLGDRARRHGVAEQVIGWTRDILLPAQLDYLRSLPVGGRLKTPDGRIRFFHGTPHDPEQKLDLADSEEKLQVLAAQFPAQLIVSAGTHIPYLRRVGEVTFLDPGSVGLSLNHEPGADVAVVDCLPGASSQVTLHKVPYDVASAAFDVLAWELPPQIAQVLKTGHG
ncbi:metallophosphoesterase [Deinococcus proteolyticus MRP]|uniref:Metallophosphoesterase n=1 Tax=Deinococcus proteolyticus (strain ATCC 35074 / DSM 20540 / JCM 6276 / NBRC 101906 / NCIMB 13154 / VKM Ac-1939 / CCM 2703 / MRP) TaxID=693977 RepID=F0RMW7_DEIPM|nr:metallophosphoesterase family protein [Deinococcus proteolyticus]ADY26109.1 metallophosphoesterase [Deinococcus proteolyticus MRP]